MAAIHHILSKTPLLVRVVSLYVFVGAAAWLAGPSLESTQAVNANAITLQPSAAKQEAAQPAVVAISGKPVRIELPRIGLVREVMDGQYDAATKQWTLTDDKTHYATMTAPINDQSGQTLIYGHNTTAVLEPVRLVKPGDVLVVTTDSGHTFTYTYSHDKVVQPTDTSVLQEHPEVPQVVLMTCEGILSDTRRLLYFDFKEAV